MKGKREREREKDSAYPASSGNGQPNSSSSSIPNTSGDTWVAGVKGQMIRYCRLATTETIHGT